MNKHNNNRTKKYCKRGGQKVQNTTNTTKTNTTNNSTRKNSLSLFSTLGTAAVNAFKQTANYAAEKGARFLGYKKIEEDQVEPIGPPSEFQNKMGQLGQEAKQIASDVAVKASQVGAVVVDTLNESIKNSGIKEKVSDAVSNTVEIAKDVFEDTNKKLNDPEFIKQASEFTKKISEDASIVLEAAEPAINKVIDQASEIGEKMGTRIGDAGVNIILNTAEAVPGIGAAIALGRDIDSATKAVGAVVEAGSETVASLASGFKETEEALKKKIAEATSLQERAAQSIQQFDAVDKIRQQPLSLLQPKEPKPANLMRQSGGGSKKYRRIRKKLSRKLHFTQHK